MKKMIALLLAAVMLCCITACGPEKQPADTDGAESEALITDAASQPFDTDTGTPVVNTPPTVGSEGVEYGFIYYDHGSPTVESRILKVDTNYGDFIFGFGYLVEGSGPVFYPAQFELRDMIADEDERVVTDGYHIEPNDGDPGTYRLCVDDWSAFQNAAVFLSCMPENCPNVTEAVIPVIVIDDHPNRYRVMVKNEDGSYEYVDYLSFSEERPTLTIAFGTTEKPEISKYWAFDPTGDDSPLVDVNPNGRNTAECNVSINTDCGQTAAFIRIEPDCTPGIIEAGILVVVE